MSRLDLAFCVMWLTVMLVATLNGTVFISLFAAFAAGERWRGAWPS